MKAAICTRYGPPEVLQLREVEKPSPKDGEVLIKIHATTVTAGDGEVRSFKMPVLFWLPIRLYMGLLKPRINILGQELAGVIKATGKDVTRFKIGEKIFAQTDMNLGAHAEYICLSQNQSIAKMPPNISFEDAASLPVGGLNALHFLKKANIQSGQHLLIKGAGGSIGIIAVQLAKHWGAEVTAVDSTKKLDTLISIGADHVIDYTKEDFTQNGKSYDIIFDVAGKVSYSKSIKSLNPGGYFLIANPRLHLMIQGMLTSKLTNKFVYTGVAKESPEDLNFISGLVKDSKIKTIIDKRYPLEEIVEAHRYVDSGHKIGSVIINLE